MVHTDSTVRAVTTEAVARQESGQFLRSGDMTGRLVSAADIAREIGVSRQTVTRWVREGIICPVTRTAGGHNRFDIDQVKAELREHLREQGL